MQSLSPYELRSLADHELHHICTEACEIYPHAWEQNGDVYHQVLLRCTQRTCPAKDLFCQEKHEGRVRRAFDVLARVVRRTAGYDDCGRIARSKYTHLSKILQPIRGDNLPPDTLDPPLQDRPGRNRPR